MTNSFDPTKLKIFKRFQIEAEHYISNRFKTKEIAICWDIDSETLDKWKGGGFKKAQHLFEFLEQKYVGLGNFALILFSDENAEDFYEIKNGEITSVYINYQKWRNN